MDNSSFKDLSKTFENQCSQAKELMQSVSQLQNNDCCLNDELKTEDIKSLEIQNDKLKYQALHLSRAIKEENKCCEPTKPNGKSLMEEVTQKMASAQIKDVQAQMKSSQKKAKKGASEGSKKSEGGAKELNPRPKYIDDREQLFLRLKEESDAIMKKKQEDSKPIKITLPDGNEKEGKSWITSPINVAEEISKTLANNAVVAKVNGVLWDLDRPFEEDSSLELITFKTKDKDGNKVINSHAQYVYWHSTAHVLGEALERVYGGELCYGPPVDNGFYYDMHMENQQVSDKHFPELESVMKKIATEKQPFERLEIRVETLKEMFKYNKFKLRLLNERVKTPTTTVYRCGSLIDLCRGPHLRHTGKVKAVKLYKNSSAYWEGNQNMETLQRVYGISFPDKKDLKEWMKFQEEAKKRDHRKIGKEQELFFFHELSPGSCFFLPKGQFIYNKLETFIREEYRKRGFQEVITPNIYNSDLWKTSGHWQHYEENMFRTSIEKQVFALKPMNCPGHCLMFRHRSRSWRELPLRMADFGVLHRNEASGALTGLTRVRRFQQDDAHIFCMQSQIKQEVIGALDFLQTVYKVFGFTFKLFLSTRPEKSMGDIALWNEAEKQLQEVLEESGHNWELNPGDGAFYGPKIDIQICDALRRPHQCATIQLDFQLPINFDLKYVSPDGKEDERPVIVHRAVLGSVERMIAILTENYAGKWPLWLSPRQVMVLSVSAKFDDYAKKVRDEMYRAGLEADFENDPGLTLNKKIRNSQLAQYNFILVVGQQEEDNNTVNVRSRDNERHGEFTVENFIARAQELIRERHQNAEKVFNPQQQQQQQ